MDGTFCRISSCVHNFRRYHRLFGCLECLPRCFSRAKKSWGVRCPTYNNMSTSSSLTQHHRHSSSTSSPHDRFSWLADFTPGFPISGKNVEIIKEPSVFYQHLLTECSQAAERIVLSSLYLGTSPLEKKLVDSVHTNLADKVLSGGPQPSVEILLDYTRGSRGQTNSRTMLLPLLADFPERVRVSLFHSPDLRGMLKKYLPERYNEVVSVQHMKIYLFDDTVMLSGANLSESYFTNRQDRYVVIRKSGRLADFFQTLVSCVGSLSFSLRADDTVTLADELDNHPYQSSDGGAAFREEARLRVNAAVDGFRQTETAVDQADKENDTWVYPLLQMGPFGLQTDNVVTKKLFESASERDRIRLASGYFNLTEDYMDTVVNRSVASFDILTASPQANGFYGAQGVSGAIPDAYTYIAKKFYAQVVYAKQQHRIGLCEFRRDGWTFHGKGLWFYLAGDSLPSLTLLGSPNFGYRSVYRDLEAQVAMVTSNDSLKQELHQEQASLFDRSYAVTEETFLQMNRAVPMWVTFVTPIIRNFF